jgi:hypothetical protein
LRTDETLQWFSPLLVQCDRFSSRTRLAPLRRVS